MLEHRRAIAGRHVVGVDIVFQQHGNTMQWSASTTRFTFLIQCRRRFERVRIECQDGVELWSAVFIRGDSGEIQFDEFCRGNDASVHGCIDSGQGRFFELKGDRCSSHRRRCEAHRRYRN
jgi:hypothetical protein